MKIHGQLLLLLLFSGCAFTPSAPELPHVAANRHPAAALGPCQRPPAQSVVHQPTSFYSRNGVLAATLSYQSGVDAEGNTEFCYLTADGQRSPTFHLSPGDDLLLTINNQTPTAVPTADLHMRFDNDPQACGPAAKLDASSTNVHFHGTNSRPVCHQDDVIHTSINSGESFTYRLHIPFDEPPGLYWYHPHIHGASEQAVLGGASGAIVIEGLQHFQPQTAGLPERLLVVRDNLVPGEPAPGDAVPGWDLSLNFIPVSYPDYKMARLQMAPGGRELWRVLNANADTILDLQLAYDGQTQPLQLVALDGVPVNSQVYPHVAKPIAKDHILLPPAARAEFIVVGPSKEVKSAIFSTRQVDTGPAGDNDVARPLASVEVSDQLSEELRLLPASHVPEGKQRFEGLHILKPDRKRKVYFSEVISDPTDSSSPTDFFITEDKPGVKVQKFMMGMAPSIVAHEGEIEDWVIENRSTERHEFHIHQIHFLLMEREGQAVADADHQLMDTVDLPYWDGHGPYPSVKVRMDFRGKIAGDFLYQCHILGHEDSGMMAVIRILPKDKTRAAKTGN